MRGLGRPRRLVALALVVAALLTAIVYRAVIAAQADAVVVLSHVVETPVLTWTVEVLTREPRVDDILVGGAPTTVVRPGSSGPWPAVVFVNGATPRGRHHPDVEALARGLARAGYVVLVPDLPGLATGEITRRTLAAAVRVGADAASHPEAEDGRIALVGVSVGASLALRAAAHPTIREEVSVVAGVAPYANLVDVVRLATVGVHEEGGRLVRYDSASFLTLVVARSLVASLPPGPDRARLLAALPATDEVDEDGPDPLARLRRARLAPLARPARAVVALLLNREPGRFEALYRALPGSIRSSHAALSPIAAAGRLRAPVELASAPRDKYFPLAESRALAAAAPSGRVTVTRTLAHAIPEPSPRDVADLFRFDGFVVRVLERANV